MSAAQQNEAASAAEAQQPEEECGWCKWMKAGGCKEQFEVWLQCVDGVRDEGREDVETCTAVMSPLWECMQKNADYYAPQVEAMRERKAQEPGSEGEGAPASASDSAAAGAKAAGSKELDLDNLTDEDMERLVEELDKESS